MADDREECLSEHADVIIRGCTALLTHLGEDQEAVEILAYRGNGYLLKGELERAIADFSEGIRLSRTEEDGVEGSSGVQRKTDLTSIRIDRAKAYEQIGRYTDAIGDLRLAMFSKHAGTTEMAVAEKGLNRLSADPTPIKSPASILDDFYVGSSNPYISKRLRAFLGKDEAENLMILDFDPAVDGQDALITESKISVAPAPSADEMEWWVINSFKNFGKPKVVRYRLAREDNIWKVFNIVTRDWDLLGMYESAFVDQ